MNKEKLKQFTESLDSNVLNQFALFMHIDDTIRLLQSMAECSRIDIQYALKEEVEKRNK
jgi:hypothetical protein